MNKAVQEFLAKNGRKGGKSKSAAKIKAVTLNLKLAMKKRKAAK